MIRLWLFKDVRQVLDQDYESHPLWSSDSERFKDEAPDGSLKLK